MSDKNLVNDFLTQAEELYGPRLPGVTFEVRESPPRGALDSTFNSAQNHVIIRIPADRQRNDRIGALAHESFHVFSPATPAELKILDEGLATQFAFRMVNYHAPINLWNYRAAWAVVDWLDHLCPNAVRELRRAQPRVALIEENEIIRVCRELPVYWAHFLVQRFYQ